MGGGGRKITLVLIFFLRAPEPGFLVFVCYGPGFFKQKVYYKSVDSDLEMDTRLIKCLVL